MATVHYRNAVLIVSGADISGRVSELSVQYSAETLDETAMGATTRINKGGLFVGNISGKLWYESGGGLAETVLWPLIGTDDVVVSLYPNGVTEGGTTSGFGFAMKAMPNQFDIGGAVGTVLPITFAFAGRGYGA